MATTWASIAKKVVDIPSDVKIEISKEGENISTYDQNMQMDELRDFDDEFEFQYSENMLNIRTELERMIDELSNYERLPFLNYLYHEKKNYFYTLSSYIKKHSIESIQLRDRICQHNEQISGNIQEDEYDTKWNDDFYYK
jgi:hypothetical protein